MIQGRAAWGRLLGWAKLSLAKRWEKGWVTLWVKQ